MYNIYVVTLFTPVGTDIPSISDLLASPKWGFYTLSEAATFAEAMIAPWSALKHDMGLSGNDKPVAYVLGETDDGENVVLTSVVPDDGYDS